MIRLIFRNDTKDSVTGYEWSRHFTIDVNLPEVEEALRSGGIGENGYCHTVLVGFEVLPDPSQVDFCDTSASASPTPTSVM